MTARTHPDDRGLAAVARVRGVRETDSRIGLQRMLMEESAVRGRLSSLESSVAAIEPAGTVPVGELVAQRTALAGAAVLIGETRDAVATAEVVSAEARARWASDRSRLAAVEHLLERRAARRRTEADRREACEADDLAAQRWQRGAR
ncbi:hypothetical protein GCM10022237_10150 [Nocardioides ginsengisoli]|uniref:Flagellar FliJ protein n=1 Tax=Nocardioides ginsengisoli TaxID=363868 RepID=A0ABW3W7L5_9ACTN